MMDYRKRLYANHGGIQAGYLYAGINLKMIKKQFGALDRYYKRFLNKDKNTRILDAGCGKGEFIFYLQESGYANSFGIDLSQAQVDYAKNLGIQNVELADLRDFLEGNKNKDKFGHVVCRDVLEHFKKEEILPIVELIRDNLLSRGTFIIQTTNGQSPFSGRLRYGDFTHEVTFTRESLAQILITAGFKKISFYPVWPAVHGVVSALRYCLWRIIELALRFYILVETGSAKGIFTQNMLAVAEK